MIRIFGILFLFSLFSLNLLASDHIDGVPSLGRHEQVDLTDLYAFPTPSKENNLTVILNLYPGAEVSAHFSSKVNYEIFIKNIELANLEGQPYFKIQSSGMTLNCSFQDQIHPNQVTCSTSLFGEKKILVDTTINSVTEGDGVKIFAGHRADPFFMTKKHFDSVTKHKHGFPGESWNVGVLNPTGGNLMEGLNVLSIAVEVDLDAFGLKSSGLLAVAAQSYTRERGYKEVLDRVGRPEITNLSLHDFYGSDPVKPAYNMISPFQFSMINMETDVATKQALEPFQERLVHNISDYDLIDGHLNWDADMLSKFVNILLDDFLVIDLNKACVPTENTFLEIEKAILDRVSHSSCGGRQITDDIFKTLYATFIAGPQGPLTDFPMGFEKPYASSDMELSKEFPYLAQPWDDQWFLKSKLLPKGKEAQEGGGHGHTHEHGHEH